MGVIGQEGCNRAKVVVFGQSGCIWAKVFAFEQKLSFLAKWLYLNKSTCIRAKVVLNGTWLRSVFAELEAFFCPKIAFQNVLQKAYFHVLFVTRLRFNGHCRVTETHLK